MGPKETRRLKRTILIGLGGTGKEALLRAKKNYVGVFGEIPPLVKFLLIDTTGAAIDCIRAEYPEGRPVELRFEPNEVLLIEARGASLLPKTHDEIRDWFPPKADLKSNIISGAGQIRALGRLALFANAHSVYEGLRALLSQARDYRVERPTQQQRFVYQPYSPHLTVCIVGSLAGGTGAGIFLDVAMILRDILKDEDQLFGYFLLPDIYVNRPGTQNVEANAYAALCELDHYMSLDGTHSYSFGGRRIEVRKKPFDMVFLVNNRNRAGKSFNQIEDMAELLGLGAFLVSGPLGKQQADVFDNIIMQLTEQQGAFYGKRAHYASFGVAELRFRPREVGAREGYQVAEKVLNDLLHDDGQSWGTTQLERQINTIKEADVREKVKEKVLANFSLPKPSESRADDPEAWQKAKQSFAELEEAVRSEALQLLSKEVKSFEKELGDELDKNWRTYYGLPSLKRGVQQLHEVAQDWIKQCKMETKSAEQTRDEMHSALERNLKNQRGLGRWLGEGNKEPRVDRSQLRRGQDWAINVGIERARLAAAEDLEKALKEKLEQFERLEKSVNEFLKDFQARVNKRTTQIGEDSSPFTVTLPPPYLEAPSESRDGHDRPARDALVSKGLQNLLQNPPSVLNEVFIGTTTSLKDWLLQVQEKDRNDPIREAVESALQELDKLSAPAWDYQEAWLANPKVARREQVHILGLENDDPNHPLLRIDGFRHVFAASVEADRKLACVPTGDPNRIYLYKIEASIPAFTLQGIEIYREKYDDFSKDRSFHVERRFEEDPPEIFPVPLPETLGRVWTKARLFGLIRKSEGTPMYEWRGEEDTGKERWHALGRTLHEAFQRLRKDFFAFKELESAVAEMEEKVCIRSRDGVEKLKQCCEEALKHCKKLSESAKNGNGAQKLGPEDLEVVNREIDALTAWIAELETYSGPGVEDQFPILELTGQPDGAAPDNHRR